jgi:hypothetical protein
MSSAERRVPSRIGFRDVPPSTGLGGRGNRLLKSFEWIDLQVWRSAGLLVLFTLRVLFELRIHCTRGSGQNIDQRRQDLRLLFDEPSQAGDVLRNA